MHSGSDANASGQDLDRDLTAESPVRRAEHLPHAALTDLGSDVVNAESRAGSEAQPVEV